MMNRKNARHPTGQSPVGAPVVLPQVVVTATDTGGLNVTVDGTPLPPRQGGTWTRGTFETLLEAITHDRNIPVRIEVHETDGTVFTDIIHTRRPTPSKPPETEPGTRRGMHANKGRQGRELVEVTADGFVPGEDVAVAVVVTQTDATSTGHVRALLDHRDYVALPLDEVGEVVLHGRISGTTRIRRLS